MKKIAIRLILPIVFIVFGAGCVQAGINDLEEITFDRETEAEMSCSPEKLLEFGDEILNSNPDKAIRMYRNAFCVSHNVAQRDWACAFAQQGLARAYFRLEKYHASMFYGKKAREMAEKSIDRFRNKVNLDIKSRPITRMQEIVRDMTALENKARLKASSTPLQSGDLDEVFGAKNMCLNSNCGRTRGASDLDFGPIETDTYIHFEFDNDMPDSEGRNAIRALAESLRSVEGIVEIIGHTDTVGRAVYNLGLSWRRAESVKWILVEKYHFDPNKFTTTGKGESDPCRHGESEAVHRMNRRVEVKTL